MHHSLHVLLTAERDGYYAGYNGDLAEIARVIERAQLYEGQVFPPTGQPRGVPSSNVPRHRLIHALQNHDQVGNRAYGERLHSLCNVAQVNAVTLLLLALPSTPMLFMGQEAGADSPFLYFTDHEGKLGEAVTKGRTAEFASFAAFRDASAKEVPDPQDETSFLRSKVDFAGKQAEPSREFHRRALIMRRDDEVLRRPRELTAGVAGSVLWVLARNSAGTRLVLLNIGDSVTLAEAGPVSIAGARVILSTAPVLHDGWSLCLPAESCSVFALATDGSRG